MDGTTQATEDLALVQECLGGDSMAMQRLYRRHGDRLYALALRLTGTVSDAEEVVQETFLRAWRNLHRFRGESAFGTWLYRITTNLCRDHLKRHQRTGLRDAQPEAVSNIADELPAGVDALARRRLEDALDKLTPRQREVLVLHDVMELDHPQIAEVLELPAATSKSHLHRARARLRRAFLSCR